MSDQKISFESFISRADLRPLHRAGFTAHMRLTYGRTNTAMTEAQWAAVYKRYLSTDRRRR